MNSKKNNLILFIINILITFSLSGQSTEKNEEKYYSFINSVFSKDTANTSLISDLPAMNQLLTDTFQIFRDTIFTMNDIVYFREQITQAENFMWSDNHLFHTKTINYHKIKRIFRKEYKGWNKFYKKYGNYFIKYSVPIFSSEKNYCFIYSSYHCGGLCGNGGTNLYKKVNGKWVFVKWYSAWVS